MQELGLGLGTPIWVAGIQRDDFITLPNTHPRELSFSGAQLGTRPFFHFVVSYNWPPILLCCLVLYTFRVPLFAPWDPRQCLPVLFLLLDLLPFLLELFSYAPCKCLFWYLLYCGWQSGCDKLGKKKTKQKILLWVQTRLDQISAWYRNPAKLACMQVGL